MSGAIDGARLLDPQLRPIAEKVTAGERLTPADGVALYATNDLLGLGLLADFVNRRKNGDRVFFSANQHLNPTNVCILRNTCVFCSFARMPKEEGAYTRSLEEVFHEAEQARGMPTREFHIVGGLHPKLRLSYYTDLIRGLKERHPEVHIKALTAVEIAHLARIERISEREVLLAMQEAGLTSLPGGGAEVFSTAVRATSPSASSPVRSGCGCTGSRTSWAFPPTAPCCTGMSRPPRIASRTCCSSARCRTTPVAS
jgi:aminodeoxyfutalosine synthase